MCHSRRSLQASLNMTHSFLLLTPNPCLLHYEESHFKGYIINDTVYIDRDFCFFRASSKQCPGSWIRRCLYSSSSRRTRRTRLVRKWFRSCSATSDVGDRQLDDEWRTMGSGAFSGPYYNNGPGFDDGLARVIAVGYDARGVWQTVPMIIHYVWNGFFYDITVRDAWNPWTRMWDTGIGIPAFQTEYTLRGVTYTYYANLSTGTYYFNP